MMNVALFSTKPYDRRFFDAANMARYRIDYFEPRLTCATAALAHGRDVVCAFVNDQLDAAVLAALREGGTRLIALRSAGFENIDLQAAEREGFTVVHVPRYSPNAVAEHTVALALSLNRRAHNRAREGNFPMDGLLGFGIYGKNVGLVGTGKVGTRVAQIFLGFGCRVYTVDPMPLPEPLLGKVILSSLQEMLPLADIVSLHCPLSPATRHLISAESISRMKRGAMLINTSRSDLVDATAVIDGVLEGQIGSFGLDVYEDEAALTYERSDLLRTDGVFSPLFTLPNVLITGHQSSFTAEALAAIAATTIQAITDFAAGRACQYSLVTAASNGGTSHHPSLHSSSPSAAAFAVPDTTMLANETCAIRLDPDATSQPV